MERFANSKPVVFLGKMVDVVWLNMLFWLCCIPVVTAGAALTALYYTSVKVIRGDRGSTVAREFFGSFRTNFKPATAVWLILLVVGQAVLYIMYFAVGSHIQAYEVAAGLCFAVEIITLVMMIYSFAVLSRFETTVGRLLHNAAVLAVRHVGASLFMVAVTAVSFTMIVAYSSWWPIMVIFVPGCYMLVLSLALEPVLAQYMPEPVSVATPEEMAEAENEKEKGEE